MKEGSVKDVLKDAAGEIGTGENPAGSNRTKYGAAYGMDGFAWCAMFTWWLLALKNKLETIKSAYTPTVADWYRQQGRFSREPKAGALVFFNFPDSLDRIQHIGIVVSFTAAQIITIEGNTSSGTSGSQDDGGGVFRRMRNRDSSIVGYAYPHYIEAPEKPEWTFPVKDWFGHGDKGGDIKNWQRDLNGYFKAKGFALPVDADGEFGAKTGKATKQFQHEQKLDVDGRVGQKTIAVMERIRERQKKKGAGKD